MVIDSHIHCGVQNVHQPYGIIRPLLDSAGISAACMFAPVEDIYERTNFNFKDNTTWQKTRSNANRYLLELSEMQPVYPYFFVWNDFRADELKEGYKGVKWHRHSNEPAYEYDSKECAVFIEKVMELQLPVVLEEEYHNTLHLLERLNGRSPLIIPHLGFLNGGYRKLREAGVFYRPNVYADTALADPGEIEDYISRYGPDRLLFGSDFPFGSPMREKQKVLALGLNNQDVEKILSLNILQLLKI